MFGLRPLLLTGSGDLTAVDELKSLFFNGTPDDANWSNSTVMANYVSHVSISITYLILKKFAISEIFSQVLRCSTFLVKDSVVTVG